ncbi:MAG: ATPase [Deltaproteobacteria bacterium CG12_big_fil_rev_8_21_14_0_65_43_10]|nr:MAG: ATPase [Deltaproteobacteria bacterium CG12_big_fil_rev_8_21_14_0_65_43_10]PIU85984.1 MAG: ATPase [Deltaproteobacteria bacterium CG06_land_8_20_14_3_00_44_19]PIX22529.1 MAG: ATPase [Deltaproteobacteria bacterium CG_4_8_14_3_um_filter_43_13]PIZ19163.1 MAG: ATPase [Deltaproteobacteria bacterium CG_4_10_14_0_8_um_filter_43_12]HCX89530.1 ATPase [Deltaproteobacteria bacterium]
MEYTKDKLPDPRELEKELNEYLQRKYGGHIKLALPTLFPKFDSDYIDSEKGDKEGEPVKIKFDMKPEELESYLDEYVVKQKEAKEILATKICTHFNRIRLLEDNNKAERYGIIGNIKNNIIMIGPTGVGKTYLIKLIAKKIGVPFVKGDATKFSETGYVGGDVEDLVRDLVHEADGNIELAQYGIIYIDEIDKIASTGSIVGPDVSRTGVQRTLLKPLEETEVDLKVAHDPMSQLEAIEEYRRTGKRKKKAINTKNILFIVSGAFDGLENIVKKKLNEQRIGFDAGIKSEGKKTEFLKHVTAEDFIKYGFESEFIGRLPVIAVYEKLGGDDLYQILKNPNSSVIISKIKDFKAYGIDVQFEDDALYMLAEKAYQEGTGARGLVSSIEKALLKFEKKLPSTDIRRFVVTKQTVENPERELNKLITDPNNEKMLARYEELLLLEKSDKMKSLKKREKEFLSKYGVNLTNNRIDLIVDRAIDKRVDINAILEEVLLTIRKVKEFEEQFLNKHSFKITFSDEASDKIAKNSIESSKEVFDVCTEILKNYEHGVKLIKEKTGANELLITEEAVDDPEGYLNKLIRDSYIN